MEYLPEHYYRAAGDAILSQNASNMSGILYSFSRIADTLNARRRWLGEGTDWFNRHPIMILFSVQMSHLAGIPNGCDPLIYRKAYEVCDSIANGNIPEGF